MENVELVQCKVNDVKKLQEISIETFSDTFKEQNTIEKLTDYLNKNYSLIRLTEELKNPNSMFFFLKMNEEIIGYLKLNIEQAQTEDAVEDALEVERIYIRKPYLGQGYGKYLMCIIEQIASYLNKHVIWLGVWEYNFSAISFYKKRGFKQSGSHTFFMGKDPQKDLILQKRIERYNMKNVIVNPEFWEIFPDAQINLLVIKNIDNSVNKTKEKYFLDLLNQGKKDGMQFLDHEIFSENKVIHEWRDAFQKFKTKKGARSSIEALLKRVNQNRDFSPINPLVDIYNSISMKYAVPAGGEDLDKIVGDLHLGKAEGGESFFPLGAEKDSPALPEELIYYDEKGAICRCLNWREAQRTMLQESTQNAILVIEAINSEQSVRADKALLELKEQVDDLLDTESQKYSLDKENPILANFL